MDQSETQRRHVWELIKDEKIAMLTTQGEGQALHARPMATVQQTFDGTLWFFTKEGAPKLGEALRRPQVCVTYANSRAGSFVSVAGKASVVQDKAKIRELWSEGARLWFPQGPEEADIRLIAIEVETAEYWESPSSLAFVYQYAKSRATGSPPAAGELGENKRVTF